MRKYSGAAVQGLAILLGMDKESAEIIRDQHNGGHDMTEWINEGLRRKKNKERASRVRPLHDIANRTIDLGNNESLSRGVFQNSDGTWTALTFSKSKTFKTEKGAKHWLKRRSSR